MSAPLFFGTLLERVAGSSLKLAIGIALLALMLYWRRLLTTASVVEEWGGRVVFAAAVVGGLLLAGILTGVDMSRATGLAATAWTWLAELAGEVWRWIEGVLLG